jgi:dnd system-associated protein 4
MGKINIEYKQGDLYETLVDEYGIFDYYYEALLFFAVIGYREDRVKRSDYTGNKADETKSEAGLQNVYSRDLYQTIAACLAFQDTGNPEALVDPEAHKRVIAQYAAGGLEYAEEEFGQTAGDPLDAIVNYIKERDDPSSHGQVDGELQKIVESFDDEMMDLG